MKLKKVSRSFQVLLSAASLAATPGYLQAQNVLEEVIVISSKQAAGVSTQDLPASVVTEAGKS